MRQVLFWIPLQSWLGIFTDIPIFGYGMMLFAAFVLCTWLACRLGDREGYPRERLQDLAIWVFITGILGARTTFMIVNRDRYHSLWEFFAIWDGGLVFYGSFIGGAVGFLLAYWLFLRKNNISAWKLMDIVAPCIALGLCLGRFGCLLNGCCFGNVACTNSLAVHFPLSSPPRFILVERGLQTPAGFTMERGSIKVALVEPNSPAAQVGLQPGDTILRINGKEVQEPRDIYKHLVEKWERGQNDLYLAVQHANGQEEVLPAFAPRTLGLHPTQIYESISMALLLFVLLAYYPLNIYDGSVFILFMVAYGVHRFLNEMLRTDTDVVAFDMTLSQNISVLLIILAVILTVVVWRRGPKKPAETPNLASGAA
jgi:prolipoprotein diacylglyceryltransferase